MLTVEVRYEVKILFLNLFGFDLAIMLPKIYKGKNNFFKRPYNTGVLQKIRING